MRVATHIFSAKILQHICVSLDANFNESLTNDIVSFEQLGPDLEQSMTTLTSIYIGYWYQVYMHAGTYANFN